MVPVPRLVVVCALACLVGAPAWAKVIHVNAAASGANDGTDWPNAYTDLQPAIAAAAGGDEIWVAAGTYKPTPTTDRTISFALKNAVAIYGGFAGTEDDRSQADPVAHVTILSGDIGAPGNNADNSFHVVTTDGSVTAGTHLDGVTITGGVANGAAPNDRGGGMWVNSGSPAVTRVIFSANFASEGGGLRVTTGGPALDHCRFTGNSVAFGGAGGGLKSGAGSFVVCTNCVFRNNTVSGAVVGAGGVESAGGISLVNTLVAQNSPSGIHIISDSNTLENCTIAHNTLYGLALFNSNSNVMTNTILWANGADGIFNDGASSVTTTYCDTQGGVVGGAGNISANPAFLAPPGDLRLGPGSMAVDAGSNDAVPAGLAKDILGLPRFFDDPDVPNTGAGTSPIVDMGAHERVPLTVSAPASASQCAGTDASFSVAAQGVPSLTYQWRRNASPLSDGGRISGSHTDTLAIDNVVEGDEGSYDVVVTDGLGQAIASPAATLTVHTAPAAPTITAPFGIAVASSGNVATVASHAGSVWNWSLTGGTITGGQGTPQVTFSAGPAGTNMLLSVSETSAGCTSPIASTFVQVDFNDVPPSHQFHDYVVAVARAGITSGCGSGNYCPGNPARREQVAVFLLRAEHGSSYSPPMCQGLFADVLCPSFFANWIEQLYNEGITNGCSTDPVLLYCPSQSVTRQQMAPLILKTEHGSDYEPLMCSPPGVFGDVACPSLFADWIERLYAENVTGGCQGPPNPLLFCPTSINTRGQVAAFIAKAFHLPLP